MRDAAVAAFGPNLRSKGASKLALQKREALQKIEKIIQRSQVVFNERHRVLHDVWEVYEFKWKVHRRQLDGYINRKAKEITLQELKDQVEKLRLLIDDVFNLEKEFCKKPPKMISLRRSAPISDLKNQ